MKHLFLTLPITLLFACNQSVKKDFTTGSFTRGKGIQCNDVKVEVNGKLSKRTEYIYGEKINLIFNNVFGLKKINGKMYPELSVCVLNNKNDTIVHNPELLQLQNGTDLSPLQLNAYFNAIMPAHPREKYKVHIDIWDKKGTGTFHYEMPFKVKKNDLLTVNNKGINFTNVYLWDETEKLTVVQNKISAKNKFYLILEGLDGFAEVNNTVFPALSINITDKNGNRILDNPNVLAQYSNQGVPPTDLKTGQIPVTITFTPGIMNNPCKLEAVLTDSNSDKQITISADLEIES